MTDADFFPFIDETDHEILMHRDAHFSGSFALMIDYYKKGGKGIQSEFSISRIKELSQIEEKGHQNLSEALLSDTEKQKIKASKSKYLFLKKLYETKSSSPVSLLVADLILTEEEEAESEIAALVAQGEKASSLLVEIIKEDDFYDPLFPGYGHAPSLAAKALSKLQDPKAIPVLFEALNRSDFFTEETILNALSSYGEKAKDFLLKVIVKTPITKDNENAAIVLLGFANDQRIAKTCLELLHEPDILSKPLFATYLVLCSEQLQDDADRTRFRHLAKTDALCKELKLEMQSVLSNWNRK